MLGKILKMIILLTLCCGGILFAGGGQEGEGDSGSIRLSMGGSTTIEPIMTSAMEVYRLEVDKTAELSYDAPGSTAGIRGVLNGIYELGAASRELYIDERQSGAVTTPIALDGLAVIVHETVPIDDISLEDLAGIYVGEINNWSKVGGPNEKITVINRDEASGTLGAFEEAVLERVYGDDARFTLNALVTESNGNMATMVSQTPFSIGYASMHVIDRVEQSGGKAVSVNGIRVAPENVYSGQYPLSRRLNVVTYGDPGGEAKIFLDFLLSPRGQEIVAEVRYLPLR